MNTDDRKLFSLLLDEMKGMRAELADLKAPITIKHESVELLEKPNKGKTKKTTKKVTVKAEKVELKTITFKNLNMQVTAIKTPPKNWTVMGAVNFDKDEFKAFIKDVKPDKRILAYSTETGYRKGRNIPCFGIACE